MNDSASPGCRWLPIGQPNPMVTVEPVVVARTHLSVAPEVEIPANIAASQSGRPELNSSTLHFPSAGLRAMVGGAGSLCCVTLLSRRSRIIDSRKSSAARPGSGCTLAIASVT